MSADGDLDHLAAVDHEHIGVAAIRRDPDSVGDIMASRARTALIAAGLVFALALLWGFHLGIHFLSAVIHHGPPLVVLTGQDVSGPALHRSPLIG